MDISVDQNTGEILSTISLAQRMEIAMTLEYERATQIHGKKNHSLHESYSVAYEEYEEALEDLAGVKKAFKEAWGAVREDNDDAFIMYVDLIRKNALRAASECIQLAAMALKAADSANG